MRLPARCWLVILLALLFLAVSSASAHNCADPGSISAKECASDGSISDTQAAVTYIRDRAEDGWTLTVGSAGGSYTWASVLTIDVARPFTFQGASPSNRPTIASTASGGTAIVVAAGSSLITIKDLKFEPWNASNNLFNVYGTGTVFRFTNNRIVGNNNFWLWTSGSRATGGGAGPFGLIDHNEIVNTAIYVRQNLDSPDAEFPNDHWESGHTNTGTWGTANAVFMEDNIITHTGGPAGCADGSDAGKMVIRYNTLNNVRIHWHGRDSTGDPSSANPGAWCLGGFLSGEVYSNTFNIDAVMTGPLIGIRSGTAAIYENAVNYSGTGSAPQIVQLQTFCATGGFASEGCRSAPDCTLLVAPLSSYPDEQQAGTPKPIGIWKNATNGVITTTDWGVGDTSFTQLDRDFFVSANNEDAKPAGYAAYTYPHPLNDGGVPVAPSNNTPPSITGVTTQGQTLTGSTGGWSAFPWPPTYAYQWIACDESGAGCANISGATASTYALQAGQIDKRIKLTVTATNSEGSTSATSALTDVVAAPGTENLLINPGFETRTGAIDNNDNNADFAGWIEANGTGYVRASTGSHGGNYAYGILRNGGTYATIAQTMEGIIVPGTVYTVSFWYWHDTANHGVAFDIRDMTNGAWIGGYEEEGPQAFDNDNLSTWRKFGPFTVTAPTGCTSIRIRFTTYFLGGAENLRVDDVVFAPPAVIETAAPVYFFTQ